MIFSCKKLALKLTESLDRPLAMPARIRLGMHLAICSECRQMKRQLILLKEAANQAGSDPETIPGNTDALSPSPYFQNKLKQTVEDFNPDQQ